MEQAVSRRKTVKIIIAPTYDDSRAKIALWNDPLDCKITSLSIFRCTIEKCSSKEIYDGIFEGGFQGCSCYNLFQTI